MPDKSVREMGNLERKHHALAARMFHSILMCGVILGAVMLAVGLGLYVVELTNQYINEAFDLSRNASGIVQKVVDVESYSTRVLEIYRELSEEEREQVGTEAYHQHFAHLTEEADYQQLIGILKDFNETSDVNDIYFAVYDEEQSALIYVADPDESQETYFPIGTWFRITAKQAKKFRNWDGVSRLFHIGFSDQHGLMCTSGVPMKNSSGAVIGYLLANTTMEELSHSVGSFLLQYMTALILVTFLLGYFLTQHMKETLVDPINEIADAALSYVQERKHGSSGILHFGSLNIRTGDEVENLSLIMADMERELIEYDKNLTKVTAEKERIGTELALATRIQADMLPGIYPAFPERPEFDVYATMTPAKEVGGDFYDFFLIDEDHLGLVIADVSGKGIPAALFMMASKILLNNAAMSGRSPGAALELVNSQICSNNREEMFVTVWLGVLELSTGRLKAANAGHEYPTLQKPGGKFELVKDRHGFVIGGMAGMRYQEYELQMEPGAKLFVYTDGVAEATNAAGTLFGTERMLAALNKHPSAAPRQILETVNAEVAAFVDQAPQFDDLTMLCLEYSGPEGKGREEDKNVKEMTIYASVKNIPAVTAFVDEHLESLGCPMKAQMQIDIAIDEIFGNIAQYAYAPETGQATVKLETEQDPLAVVITFIDRGVPYDPLAKEDPDISLDASEREAGGLGIFLVKKTMDDMSYEYKDGQNILRIRKKL